MKKEITIMSLFGGLDTGRLALENLGYKINKNYYSDIKPAAIELTKYHNPDTIFMGNIENWKKWKINWEEIDFIFSGSPCFVSNTKILTKDGYKNIENINISDYVLTHKNRFQKVIKIGNTYNTIYKIKAQGIKLTSTTGNHPYYVRKMTKKWNSVLRKYERVFSNPKWIEVKDLDKNHFVGLPIIKEELNDIGLTKEDAWIIGRYIADGHTRKDYKKRKKPTRHWQLILSVGDNKINDFDNIKLHYSIYKHTQNTHRIVFSNKRLVEIAEKYAGIGAKNKKISYELLKLPKSILNSLLDGYMSGDGCYTNNKFKATSISEELIMSLNLAIAKIYGVNSSFDFVKRPKTSIIDGRIVNQNNTYSATFNKEMKKQSKAIIINDIIWLPIKHITKTNIIDRVYNLEVENDNSYTANNAIVHNCQDLSIAGKRKGIKGSRSSLFFTFVDILNHVKTLNPNVLFLQENVGSAPKKDVGIMSRALGIYPVRINSNLVTAQNRDRYYWTNIRTKKTMFDVEVDIPQPKDRKIMFKDILTSGNTDLDKSYCLLESESRPLNELNQESLKNRLNKAFQSLVWVEKKEVIIKTNTIKGFDIMTENDCLDTAYANSKTRRSRLVKEKSPCLLAGDGSRLYSLKNYTLRLLNKTELCRLQGFEDTYCDILSRNKAASLLGDGWTLPVIEHILKFIK